MIFQTVTEHELFHLEIALKGIVDWTSNQLQLQLHQWQNMQSLWFYFFDNKQFQLEPELVVQSNCKYIQGFLSAVDPFHLPEPIRLTYVLSGFSLAADFLKNRDHSLNNNFIQILPYSQSETS